MRDPSEVTWMRVTGGAECGRSQGRADMPTHQDGARVSEAGGSMSLQGISKDVAGFQTSSSRGAGGLAEIWDNDRRLDMTLVSTVTSTHVKEMSTSQFILLSLNSDEGLNTGWVRVVASSSLKLISHRLTPLVRFA